MQQNGDVIVDETVTFSFQGNYHYMARNIPTGNYRRHGRHRGAGRERAVAPQGRHAGTYSTFKEGESQYIQVNFDLTDTSATWTFHYRAKKVVSVLRPAATSCAGTCSTPRRR